MFDMGSRKNLIEQSNNLFFILSKKVGEKNWQQKTREQFGLL